MHAFHLLALVEVGFLYCFYNLTLFNKIYYSGLAAMLLINVLNTLFIENLSEFNSTAWSINSILLMAFGLAYLLKLYQRIEAIRLERDPVFVINSGILMYCSGSLFTYILGSEILSGDPRGFFHNAWLIQCISNITRNFIAGYGLWLTRLY